MNIPAIDLLGEYHLKLFALEKYFMELADIGESQPTDEYLEEKAATAQSLDHLRRFRLEFEALRHKHKNELAQTLAGGRPRVTLNPSEALLIESITDMYDGVWSNRRERLAES